MSLDRLQFIEDGHRYVLDGRNLPSVSRVLAHEKIKEHFGPNDDYYLRRGTYVHRACEYYDRGTLDADTLDDHIAGYLEAWKAWKRDIGFVPDMIEQPLYHPVYMVAGMLDRTGTIGGRHFLIDIKSGNHARWHEIQTAAYADMAIAHDLTDGEPIVRATVALSPDGKYNMKKHKDENDFQVWRSAVMLARWKGGIS